jgi:hypothetical protein
MFASCCSFRFLRWTTRLQHLPFGIAVSVRPVVEDDVSFGTAHIFQAALVSILAAIRVLPVRVLPLVPAYSPCDSESMVTGRQ